MKSTFMFGPCNWNGNEIVCDSHPELGGVAGIGNNVPEEWAKVFAAAPEMLEALEELVRQADTFGCEGLFWDMARAAIAKAKGEVS